MSFLFCRVQSRVHSGLEEKVSAKSDSVGYSEGPLVELKSRLQFSV